MLSFLLFSLQALGAKEAVYHLTWGAWGGASFPGIRSNTSDWQVRMFRVTGTFVGFSKRFSNHWSAGVQLSYHEFWLSTKGPREDYVFDFLSPQVSVGMLYHPQRAGFQRAVVRLMAGGQWGFNSSFEEEEPDYRVEVDAPAVAHFFLAPEVGKMIPLTQPTRKLRYQISLEVSCYARWQWNGLGTAKIESARGTLEMAPKGNALGLRLRLWGPVGRASIKINRPSSKRNSPNREGEFKKHQP